MSCKDCERVTDETDHYYPYRWSSATILIVACPEHAKEVMEALNKLQREEAI